MKTTARHIFKRLFVIITIAAVVFFLLACLAAHVNPVKYWLISFLGVGFIFFLALLILLFIFWFILGSRWAWLPLITIMVGWGQVHVLFGLHPFTHFKMSKPEGAIRIMQWNVSRWDEMKKKKRTDKTYRLNMFNYIKKMDPDILCFQEFFESKDNDLFAPNVSYITNKLHYPYHYFVVDFDWWDGHFQHGVAIFSHFPIVDTLRLRYRLYDTARKGESLIRATINVNGRRINVFTTHLQSFGFHEEDYNNIAILKSPEDHEGRLVSASKGLMYKFRNAYRERFRQADTVRQQLDKTEYPSIITGDFNDVPNSYTYNTIKGEMQDAFVKKGFGLGRTFFFISPTLRIDYVLTGKEFDVLQYNRDLLPYSDHYPVIADVKFK